MGRARGQRAVEGVLAVLGGRGSPVPAGRRRGRCHGVLGARAGHRGPHRVGVARGFQGEDERVRHAGEIGCLRLDEHAQVRQGEQRGEEVPDDRARTAGRQVHRAPSGLVEIGDREQYRSWVRPQPGQ